MLCVEIFVRLSANSGRNHELGDPTELPRLYVCGH